MTRQVLGVSPDQPLSEVASMMVNKNADLFPVIGDGKLVGVLTRADFLRKLIGY
jgi:CBS domain-containing protein